MVLYLVGLGLGDEKDITVRGLEAVRGCEEVWLESYTSVLGVEKSRLEEFYGKDIREASRETVESDANEMLANCVQKDVAVLVVGDPLCATTHTDLALRAREMGARVEVIQNASVMAAVARCGLQLYRFGQTVSIPYFEGEWRPTSFYEKIAQNAKCDVHTLCLLDIKTKEPDFALLAKTGRVSYLPPRFMSCAEAAEQLLECESIVGAGVCRPDTLAVGLARLGQPDQAIRAATLDQLRQSDDLGGPLHSLVVCASLHDLETDFLAAFGYCGDDFVQRAREEVATHQNLPPPPEPESQEPA